MVGTRSRDRSSRHILGCPTFNSTVPSVSMETTILSRVYKIECHSYSQVVERRYNNQLGHFVGDNYYRYINVQNYCEHCVAENDRSMCVLNNVQAICSQKDLIAWISNIAVCAQCNNPLYMLKEQTDDITMVDEYV